MDRPVFPERLTRVATAMCRDLGLDWDGLPEHTQGTSLSRGDFREMARAAMEELGMDTDD